MSHCYLKQSEVFGLNFYLFSSRNENFSGDISDFGDGFCIPVELSRSSICNETDNESALDDYVPMVHNTMDSHQTNYSNNNYERTNYNSRKTHFANFEVYLNSTNDKEHSHGSYCSASAIIF